MKKIDKLLLGSFIGPFTMTFLVVVFILLTQHMLKYFDDIIGKGLGFDVIGRLLFYFAIFMTPVAMPLAVLLSSLIAFGNLGEHFELTAIKSAGVSLVRAMRPLFLFVLVLTGFAFYANNNLVPKAALEAYSLLYDIKQKKPALDLREGVFYNGINDISIKVDQKFPDDISLKNVIVYDHRKNDGNKEVTIADSGRMFTILNDRYLKFELFNGYNYTQGAGSERELTGQQSKSSETISRTKFSKSQIVFDLSSFDLQSTDKKWFQGNRIMRNLYELDGDIDSIKRELLTQRLNHYLYRPTYFTYYLKSDSVIMPIELYRHRNYRDSVMNLKYQEKYNTGVAVADNLTSMNSPTIEEPVQKKSRVRKESNQVVIEKEVEPIKPIAKIKEPETKTEIVTTLPDALDSDSLAIVKKKKYDSLVTARLDSVFLLAPNHDYLSNATNMARQVKSQLSNVNNSTENYQKELAVFEIQWHKILASSFACIAMFLIGAPLGAIIKKGGLGVPFLISILFFIIYYVLTMQGEKLAKQETVSPLIGIWMADVILLVIGLFFLRQARIDARLFDSDFYAIALDKIKHWINSKKPSVSLNQKSV